MTKCQLTWCGRESRSKGYCNAHALRLSRGGDVTKPFRPRGKSERRQVLEEVAIICEYWANNYMSPEVHDLAALFRKLK